MDNLTGCVEHVELSSIRALRSVHGIGTEMYTTRCQKTRACLRAGLAFIELYPKLSPIHVGPTYDVHGRAVQTAEGGFFASMWLVRMNRQSGDCCTGVSLFLDRTAAAPRRFCDLKVSIQGANSVYAYL